MELQSLGSTGETECSLVLRNKDMISISSCLVKLRTQLSISKEMGAGVFKINTLNPEFYRDPGRAGGTVL